MNLYVSLRGVMRMWENGVLMVMVMGLSELLKRIKLINSKFIPLWNMLMALSLNLFYRGFTYDGIILGILLGIGTTGVYSSCKNILEGL